MYCPQCSQHQASDDMRFCSRCGFQLGVVKELLAQNDAPAPATSETQAPLGALRKRDVTVGALIMFIIALIILFISPSIPPPVRNGQMFILVVLFFALTLFINFITPLLRAVSKLFSEGDTLARERNTSSSSAASDFITRVNPQSNNAALPPSKSMPVLGLNGQRVNTAEIVQPFSVTEHTTGLLKNDRD